MVGYEKHEFGVAIVLIDIGDEFKVSMSKASTAWVILFIRYGKASIILICWYLYRIYCILRQIKKQVVVAKFTYHNCKILCR